MNTRNMSDTGDTPRPFNFSEVQALALDLDGTLLMPDNTLSRRAIAGVQSFLARGGRVVICTGRSFESAEPYRRALDARGPMVYFNGAEVAEEKTLLYTAFLDTEIAAYCVDLSRELGVYYQMYAPAPEGGSVLLAERRSPEGEGYHKHTRIEPVIRDLREELSGPNRTGCIKGMFICEPERHDVIRDKITARFNGRMTLVRSSRTFLEIMRAGVSKGQGLREVLSRYHIDRSRVMAFGDEENDLSLFAAAGFAAAPANAKPEIRAAADMVIGSNAEDGVAAFLETLTG